MINVDPPKSSETLNDLSLLIETLSNIAADRLHGAGEFVPFATMILKDGSIELCNPQWPDSESNVTISAEIIAQLEEMLQYKIAKNECQAYGICSNVITTASNLDRRVNAICLALYQPHTRVIRYYIPYKMLLDSPVLEAGFYK